jgi:hypothetical protein
MKADALMNLAEVHRVSGDPQAASDAVMAARELYEAKGDIASVSRASTFRDGLVPTRS